MNQPATTRAAITNDRSCHRLLVLNAGSSSLKFAVFQVENVASPRVDAAGQVSRLDGIPRFIAARTGVQPADILMLHGGHGQASPHRLALGNILAWLDTQGLPVASLSGAGHRIVHGGTRFTTPVLTGDDEVTQLDALKPLAPLHMSYGIEVVRHMRSIARGLPQVACFDTAFHAGQPDIATRLALPADLHAQGYRRYGFHGLSYEHVVDELPRMAGAPLPSRLLVFHLGSGASLCAIKDGRSAATTMGYSTLDGLVMGTRSGNIDPGVLIALMRDKAMGPDDLEDLLYRRSGLLALSGITSDMRQLLSAATEPSVRAVEHYCYWAARHAASLVVALGGLDAIVFTGGVGENASPVRTQIAAHLDWLGVKLDAARNADGAQCISVDGGKPKVWIVPANEELAIARHASALLFPAN